MHNSPVIVLVAVIMLIAACTGDGTPSPGVTPRSIATPILETTPRSEVTATQAPSTTPTRVPSPTPVQTAETQASPPLPAATATPRPDGLQFHFGPGVSDFDRSLITRAVEVTSELLSAGAEVRPPSAVFAYSSPAQLERAFADESLAQTWRSQGMARRMAQQVAEASYRGIVINTGSAGWLELDATQRLRAVAHEYVHVIQLERAGQEVADSTLLGSSNQTPPTGPFWLLEGAAEVVSWLVLQELSLGTYADALFDYAGDAGESDATLEELSSFIGYRAAGKEGVGLAVLATDYLLRSRSLDAMFDFWGGTSVDAPWTASFARHFGLPVDFFYLAFATYYENTWEGFTP